MLSLKRWNDLILSLCNDSVNSQYYENLMAAYSKEGRHYHNLKHIEFCLKELEGAKALTLSPHALEFAIWLHDAVYDTHSSENEKKSASLAVEILKSGKCHENVIRNVWNLIMATQHGSLFEGEDTGFIVDIDLSILGQSADLFDAYESAIQKEYAWVPKEIFRSERVKILEGFLNKEYVYVTDFFKNKYEREARENLSRAIERLGPRKKRIIPKCASELP